MDAIRVVSYNLEWAYFRAGKSKCHELGCTAGGFAAQHEHTQPTREEIRQDFEERVGRIADILRPPAREKRLLCVQEVDAASLKTLLAKLGPHWKAYAGQVKGIFGSAILWDERHFTPTRAGRIKHLSGHKQRLTPAVELQERSKGGVLRIASAHLFGYPIAQKESGRDVSELFGRGEKQLQEILSAMRSDDEDVSLNIIAMDGNFPLTQSQGRDALLKEQGYRRDETDDSPSHWSRSSGRRRLDHIYAQASGDLIIKGEGTQLSDYGIEDAQWASHRMPSDHLAVSCRIDYAV